MKHRAAKTARPSRPPSVSVDPSNEENHIHQPHNLSVLTLRSTPDASQVVGLQRFIGNRATQRLMREPDAETPESGESDTPDTAGMSEEAALFEKLMSELSDDEIDAGFERLAEEEKAEKEGGESESTDDGVISRTVAAPPSPQKPPAIAAGRIQRGKTSPSIAGSNPDLKLAGRLEKNSSKMPRLVTLSRWNKMKRKHTKLGFVKYAAVLHRNLFEDTLTENLVLLVRVGKRIPLNSMYGEHFKEIEKKSRKKGIQTAQVRTELTGEVIAAIRMRGYLKGNGEMLVNYASGAGIDQLWRDNTTNTYYVVEAKGTNAKRTVNRFAVRGVGTKGGVMVQMSKAWIANRMPLLKNKYPLVLNQLLTDCGLKVHKGNLVRDNAIPHPTHTLEGLTIKAVWNRKKATLSSGMSKSTTF